MGLDNPVMSGHQVVSCFFNKRLLVVLLGTLLGAGCAVAPQSRIMSSDGATTPPTLAEVNRVLASAAIQTPSSADYRIGSEDLLQITLFNVSEENVVMPRTIGMRVSQQGIITLPLLGEISAAGLTASALEQALREQYEKYIYDPQVGVLVKERAAVFFVDGAVGSPGSYPLNRPYTLTQALTLAGGVENNPAKYDSITIFRRQGPARVETITADLDNIRAGEATDPLVQADDFILVPTSASKLLVRRLLGVLSVGVSAPVGGAGLFGGAGR